MKEVVLLKSRIAVDGGAEKYTKRLAVAFHRKGCHVILLTNGKLPKESVCEVISDENLSPLSFRRVQTFDRFCRKVLPVLNAPVVFGLDRNRSQTHLRASNGTHAAYLEERAKECSFFKQASFAINPLHRTLLNIEKTSFEDPELKKLYVNSAMVREEILSHYRVDPKKIHVFHNGVEWEEMEGDFALSGERRSEIIKELQLPAAAFHFLFVGHNYKRKGLHLALKAFALLSKEDVHLSVVGKEKDMPFFKTLTHSLGIGEKVSFFGARPDVRKFYQMADSLVIPSFYDPFANVTVEALAMGLFVVSSKRNGGSEVLTPTSGALIEDLQSVDSLATALKSALEHPKTAESGARIRASVEHLDFSKQLERLVDETLL